MSKAKICDNCKKIINDIEINLTGYKVKIQKTLGYEIQEVEDFCSFNCLSEWANKQQMLLEESEKVIDKHKMSNVIPEQN